MGIDLAPRRGRVPLQPRHRSTPPATMVDFAAGHITSEQSHPIIAALDARARRRARRRALPPRRRVPPPVRRAGATGPTPTACRRTTSPGSRRCCPTGPAAAKLIALMDASRPVVRRGRGRGRLGRDPDLAVGPGRRARRMPAFADRYGVEGRLTLGGRPRPRARGAHRASTSSTCPARPPGSTTTTPASATPCLGSLADRDFFLLHVEATDEAGHQGAVDEKVRRARALGRRDHRPARRGARRRGRTGSCCCPTTPRRARA